MDETEYRVRVEKRLTRLEVWMMLTAGATGYTGLIMTLRMLGL